ncbi:MFS transporter [Halorussus salinus]|uniref:hypothetical protein n=1 Tax=Halorussus salinus TaxID=1364935 RepID=UPI001092F2B2|nr:hypothetical protein [Halorussus salinus]
MTGRESRERPAERESREQPTERESQEQPTERDRAATAGRPRGLAAFRDLHEREPGLFAVAVLTLGVGLATRVLVRVLPAYLRALGTGPAAIGVVWAGWSLARLGTPLVGGALRDYWERLDPNDHPFDGRIAALREEYVADGSGDFAGDTPADSAGSEPDDGAATDSPGRSSRVLVGAFGLVAAAGYLLWVAAPQLGSVGALWWALGPWRWTLAGAVCLATWYSHGPGVTVGVVERRLPTEEFAERTAAALTFRRVGLLVGLPVLAGLLVAVGGVSPAFQVASAGAASLAVAATVGRLVLDPPDAAVRNRTPPSLDEAVAALRDLAGDERAFVVGESLVRAARGLSYPFLVLAVADFGVTATLFGGTVEPAAVFAGLLAAETLAALLATLPAARLTDRVGEEVVAGAGALVVSLFPLALAATPPNALVAAALFAGFGVGLAARPTREQWLVTLARRGDSRDSLRLVVRGVTVPSALVGGVLYAVSPTLAFGLATSVGLLGCRELLRYAR